MKNRFQQCSAEVGAEERGGQIAAFARLSTSRPPATSRQRLGVRWVKGEGTHRFRCHKGRDTPTGATGKRCQPHSPQPPHSKTLTHAPNALTSDATIQSRLCRLCHAAHSL